MDQRREARFPIQVGTAVKVNNDGRIACATTVNGSGCGVLLEFAELVPLAVGDRLTCDFSIADHGEVPLPCWAVGNVASVEGRRVAINFKGAGFYPMKSCRQGITQQD